MPRDYAVTPQPLKENSFCEFLRFLRDIKKYTILRVVLEKRLALTVDYTVDIFENVVRIEVDKNSDFFV